jgi:YidC/Oxa1 family membrane protein insertase
MDKNTVFGLLTIGAIIVVFSIWTQPNKKQLEAARRNADSIALVQQKAIQEKAKEAAAKDTLKENIKEESKAIGSFSKSIEEKTEFFTLENDVMKIRFTNKGGKPYSVELKNYKTFDKKPLILFSGDSTIFGFNFFTQNNLAVSTNNLFFKLQGEDSAVLASQKNDSIALRLYSNPQSYIEYLYTMKPHSYMVDFKVNLVHMDSIITNNNTTIDLNWQYYVPALEKVKNTEKTYTSVYYKFFQSDVEKFAVTGKDTAERKDIRNRLKWIAYKQQFFSSVIIADNLFENAAVHIKNITDTSERYLDVFSSELGIPYESKPNQTINLTLYYGPNHYTSLKKYKMDLEELVFMGDWRIIKWINRYTIVPVFNFLNNYIGNYGIIILILTIIIKIVLFPLSFKSYFSMAKMKVLKPQIDEINEKIPKEKPMERQQATMALYKKAGVNPMGGCLPMLLQMPILIAMFRFFPTSIELRQQGFLWATDLSSYDSIFSWSTHIPIISEFWGNHISLFNLLMTATTIITIKMQNQANTSQQMPGMKFISYMMPIMFMFLLNSWSSGLTYYYFLVNLITILQNEIFRRSINEEKLLLQLNENKKKPVKKSKWQMALEQAQKQQQTQKKRK